MASWWYVVSAERKAAKLDGGHGSAGLSVPHCGRQHALAGFLRRREFRRIGVGWLTVSILCGPTIAQRSTSGGSEGTSIAVQRLDPASGQVADVGVTCDG
jgi:hypothetical protein